MAKMAICNRTDCFACADNKCRSLSDNNFKGECSFFKKKKDGDWDEIQAACKAYAESHGGDEE